MQEHKGRELVVEFTSRTISKEERSYGITEKEALGIVLGVE